MLKQKLQDFKSKIENRIKQELTTLSSFDLISTRALTSSEYSLISDSKYIRSFILDNANPTGKELISTGALLDLGLAIELVHTYSLLHDDLPSMDNDDMRRGKPSNHKQFDEATAVLTADGFQSLAFEVITDSKHLTDKEKVIAIKSLSKRAGFKGMVGGQFFDLQLQGQIQNSDGIYSDFSDMKKTGFLKTGKLFEFCFLTPFLIAKENGKATDDEISTVKTISRDIGELFQITDDLLEKTGLDEVNFVSVLGEEKARQYLNELCERLSESISKIYGQNHIFMELVNFLKVRTK